MDLAKDLIGRMGEDRRGRKTKSRQNVLFTCVKL